MPLGLFGDERLAHLLQRQRGALGLQRRLQHRVGRRDAPQQAADLDLLLQLDFNRLKLVQEFCEALEMRLDACALFHLKLEEGAEQVVHRCRVRLLEVRVERSPSLGRGLQSADEVDQRLVDCEADGGLRLLLSVIPGGLRGKGWSGVSHWSNLDAIDEVQQVVGVQVQRHLILPARPTLRGELVDVQLHVGPGHGVVSAVDRSRRRHLMLHAVP